MGSVSGGHSRGKGRSTTSTRIPKFLRPLARQSAETSQAALTNLAQQLNNDDLVADFTGPQDLAHMIGTGRALGDGGFFPTAQNTILNAAQGDGLSFVPDDARTALGGAAQGSNLDFIPPEVLQRLQSGGGDLPGTSVLEAFSQRSSIPGQVMDVLGAGGSDFDVLTGVLEQQGVSPEARRVLENTAQGDHLAGGQGFQEAVDSAVRAATPAVLSTFGRAGVGGNTGGLAQTAIAKTAIDAFADQYANERSNQLGAAGRLSDLDLAERGQDASIATTLEQLGLSSRGLDIDGASALGSLSLSDAGQRGDFANALAQLGLSQDGQDLSGLNTLTQLFGDERSRQLGAADTLADLSQTERANQLNAAGMLPGLAMADVDVLNNIGLERQAQNQRQIQAPIDAQLQLLMASMGIPSSMGPFLGSGTSNRNFNHFGQAKFSFGGMGGMGGGG